MNLNKHFILRFHLLITLFFISLGAVIIWCNASFYSYSYLYAWMYFLLSSWIVLSYWLLTERIFDLYTVMLLSALVFLGGGFFLKLFFPNTLTILAGESVFPTYSKSLLNSMTAYIFWGISLLHLGGLIGVISNKLRPIPKGRVVHFTLSKRALRVVGWGLIFISIVPQTLIQIRTIKVTLQGSYKALTGVPPSMGYGSIARILSTFIIPGTIFVLAGSDKRFLNTVIPLSFIILYSSLEFFAGDRSTAAMPLVMVIIVWDRRVNELPKWKIALAGILILFLILPLVQVVRHTSGSARLSFSYYLESYGQIGNPVFLILDSFANSMGHLPHTLKLVPSKIPFSFGESYVRGFTTIFPNLFWETHPGSNFFGGSQYGLTLLSKEAMSRGRGLGYNLLAEAYRNFGVLGVMIIPMLFGFWIGKITAWGEGGDPAKFAMMVSFGAFILQIPRGYVGSAMRPFVWYAFIPYMLVIMAKRIIGLNEEKLVS